MSSVGYRRLETERPVGLAPVYGAARRWAWFPFSGGLPVAGLALLVPLCLVSPALGVAAQPDGPAEAASQGGSQGVSQGPESRAETEQDGEAGAPAETLGSVHPDIVLDAWSRAWTPGEAHERLASRAGLWKLTTRTWADPSEEPVVTETTAVREMVLGGRYLQEHLVGEIQGIPFEARGYLGYDNVTGRWWSTWMDTLSTAVVLTTGTRDPQADEIVLTGEYADPLTGETRSVRTIHRFLDVDTEAFEWWEVRDGTHVKTMEILYQRQ